MAPVVAVAAAALPELPADTTSLIKAKWSPTKYLGHRTIRSGLPPPKWRKMHEGIRYSDRFSAHIKETNKILEDLEWIEGDRYGKV